MRRIDPRAVAVLALLALSILGAVLERRSPAWIHMDPLLRPFGAEAPEAPLSGASSSPSRPPMPVLLGSATAEELVLLPGIGPVTAQRILAFRDSLGPIRKHAELLAVRGIGPKKLERLEPWILLGEGHQAAADSLLGP